MIETYIPLYRKYRPQAFADVVGQEAIVQTLGNALTLNKIAHAYLLCGPRGTGKTSTARIFAKSLNCEQGPTTTPCQTCASCVGITAGNALDVVEFDAASNNGVNDARELIENCQYSSMSGRFKVYIIDEVHMLTTNAFNALLKTLEEPPPNVIFIFATTEAHKVLPTIISRCQRFDFTRITTQNIGDRLRYIAEQENIRINDDAISMIARHARGGMRDAVGLLDQVSVLGRAQADKIIDRADVAMFIGALEEDLLLNLAGAIVEKRAADLLSEIGVLAARGIEPNQLVKDLTMHFRNLLLVKVSGAAADSDLLSLPADYHDKLKAQAKLFSNEELPLIISRMAGIERNLRHTPQPQLWLEVGLLELAYRQDIDTVENLARRVSELEARLANGVTPAPSASTPTRPQAPAANPAYQAPQPTMAAPSRPETPMPQSVAQTAPQAAPQPTAPAAAGGGSLDALYERLIQTVASPPTKSLLKDHTFALSQAGDLLTIGCGSDSIMTLLKNPAKMLHVQKAADQLYGRPMRVDIVFEKKPAGFASSAAPVPPPPATPAPQPVMNQSSVPQPAVASAHSYDPSANAPSMPPEAPAPAAPVAVMEREEPMFAAPPMEREEPMFAAPPMGPDDGWPEEEASAPAPARPPQDVGPTPELDEAKQYTKDLLQGRVLE